MGFYENLEANDMRTPCFGEDGRFFDKILELEQCSFQRTHVFYKIWALEQYFFTKIEKKGILLTVLPHNILQFDRIDVFCPNMGMAARGFSFEIKKNDLRVQFFRELGFFDNIWA